MRSTASAMPRGSPRPLVWNRLPHPSPGNAPSEVLLEAVHLPAQVHVVEELGREGLELGPLLGRE